MTDHKITEPAMTELTPKEEQKLKELAVDYFEGNPLGLPPSSADVIEGMREAAQALVDKLDEINDSQSYRSAFAFLAAHGEEYDGPNYSECLEALRTALALPDSKPDNQGGT